MPSWAEGGVKLPRNLAPASQVAPPSVRQRTQNEEEIPDIKGGGGGSGGRGDYGDDDDDGEGDLSDLGRAVVPDVISL